MERVMSELANYFLNKGYQVHIFFLVKHVPFYKIDKQITCHFPKRDYGEPGELRLMYWFYILIWLRKGIKGVGADTVFSIPQDYSNLTILALLGTGIPVFISDRNSPNMPIPIIKKNLRKLLYPLASGVILQTSTAKKLMLRKGIYNKNIKIIPNPLKIIQNYPKSDSKKKIILNIGRLVNEKNQLELIRIFAKINNSDWNLYIAGDGPLKNQLQSEISVLGMDDSIKLLGSVKNVDKLMGQVDIFAFTSIYEGFPNSLNEAMAYPLPCISYNCIAGPSDLIKNNVNGFLVEPGDFNDYVTKLKLLMENEKLRIRLRQEAAKNRELFSIENIGNQYLNFILGK